MIDENGWLDWAIIYPVPEAKLGYYMVPKYQPNKEGLVFHSAEGWAGYLLYLVADMGRQASWVGSNMIDGQFYQHYPITATAWANGSIMSNLKFIGIENEGIAGLGLSEAQVSNLVRLAQDCKDFFGWSAFTRQVQAWEHNEMTSFGSASTACPSGRIPWDTIIERIGGEMTAEQYETLRSALQRIETALYGNFPDASGNFNWDNVIGGLRKIRSWLHMPD